MRRKALTVIVPAYNMELLLPTCLGGLETGAAGTDALEVLVVNDGSTDGTEAVARAFADRLPDVFRVIDKPNGNYGSCVNAALACATGEYVKVLDADDAVVPAAFARYLRFVERACGDARPDLIVSDYEEVSPAGEVGYRRVHGLPVDRTMRLDELPRKFPRFQVHAIAYRRENLLRMGYRQSEGVFYTDTEWFVEPMTTVREFVYFPEVVTRYLVGRAGQTTDPSVRAGNFWMMLHVAEGIAARYGERLANAEPAARDYYREQVRRVVWFAYYVPLFGWGGSVVSADLARFDSRLREVSPELHAWAAEARLPSAWYPLRFVSKWRRRGAYAPSLRLARLLRRLSHLMRGI